MFSLSDENVTAATGGEGDGKQRMRTERRRKEGGKE